MKRVRCAIYTRKSSEEGLEQGFNSLDAQREACAAYVLSQASEGWSALPDIYDDGGISGGTLERPALQRLLADVAAGRIDIIVVYKVDRLTRSLLDFAKLVEAFDKAGVSFVSITQSFNTTTSMGRLTLNMLLSFAQFEREVTAERIRDKLAASKAKGMWMGGTPPLGYAPNGRTLAIVENHAAIVRDIYRRYLALGSVRLVEQALDRERIRTPLRRTGSGRDFGGVRFTRGQLYAILKSPIYAGDVPHRDRVYPGLHPPLVERVDWDRVQAMLANNLRGARQARATNPSPLAGRLVDADGAPLLATHACKAGKRFRYYVSRALHHGEGGDGLRIPARELETMVAAKLAELLADPVMVAARIGVALSPAIMAALDAKAAQLRVDRGQLFALVEQVRVTDRAIHIAASAQAISEALGLSLHEGSPGTLDIVTDAALARSGRMLRLVHDGQPINRNVDVTLVGLIARARRWWATLARGELMVSELAAQEGVSKSYVSRVVRLAFLTPAIVESILDGRQPAALDTAALKGVGGVPVSWAEQMKLYPPV